MMFAPYAGDLLRVTRHNLAFAIAGFDVDAYILVISAKPAKFATSPKASKQGWWIKCIYKGKLRELYLIQEDFAEFDRID